MSSNNIMADVAEILTEQMPQIGAREITLQARLVQDLGADSLDINEIIFAIEERFGIEVDDGDEEKLQTVNEVCDYVARKKKESGDPR